MSKQTIYLQKAPKKLDHFNRNSVSVSIAEYKYLRDQYPADVEVVVTIHSTSLDKDARSVVPYKKIITMDIGEFLSKVKNMGKYYVLSC